MTDQQPSWHGRFIAIWSGQQMSQIAGRAAQLALTWWAMTTGTPSHILGVIAILGLVPSVLLGPIAGALVDRWNRRRILLVAGGVRSLIAVVAVILLETDVMKAGYAYLLILAFGTAGVFNRLALRASITLLVPKRHYIRVGGMDQVSLAVLWFVGAVFAATLESTYVMLISVVLPLVGLLPLRFYSVPQPNQTANKAIVSETDSRVGSESSWKILLRPGLLAFTTIVLGVQATLALTSTLAPLALAPGAGLEGADYSLYLTVLQISSGLCGLVLLVFGGFRKRLHTLLLSIAGLGAGLGLLGWTPWIGFDVALLSAAVIGSMSALWGASHIALFQAGIPPETQGRVFGTIGALASLAILAMTAVYGFVDVLAAYRASSLVCTAIFVGALLLPALRSLEPPIARQASADLPTPSED